uniref:Dynein heavy chain, cytoplasmic n=1 Tax=Romanomermis culicivorax TaxID=13658 RepID=A0A915HKX7_ROMCU
MSDSGSETAVIGSPATPGRDVSQLELIETASLADYLVRIVSVLLEDDLTLTSKNTKYLQQCVNETEVQETFKRFISDHQVPVLLVERISSKENEDTEISATESEAGDITDSVTYQLSTNVHFTNARTSGLVFIKRGPALEADKSIGQQLRTLTLTDGSPYETLHSYISTAVAPFFKSYVRETGLGDGFRDGDKVAPSVEKKLVELEMGLLHLQQNIDIPDITLSAHQTIQTLVKKASDDNRRPKIADLGDKVEDSTFLNQLQSGVNRWIRDIQKVTNMDRDPSSGTSLQEITFWLNLERALLKLKEKRDSPEVALTLEALKHGKRFRAVVSFDSDTGLNQAIEKVSDYNVLMKDFPINDLLSATELEKIRHSIFTVFNHLRKIRITRYPIQRCLRLVESISRDLQVQMLKVLNTRRLMHISFDEFDKIMLACFDIFSCWDDEYDKLQALLRELIKNKRSEQMKMVWRISPTHKKLQARLEQMRKFRRLHEQLRTVIGRVLASHVASGPHNVNGQQKDGSDQKAQERASLFGDQSDKEAIQEVTLSYENVKEVDCLDLSKEGTDSWEAALKRYEERIDRVEARITTRLRDQLGAAKNANEMFRIFSRFNALFVRPHIRGAIREYQTQLIQRVKEDIEALHEQFKVQYSQSKCSSMSNVRDLPNVSGSIIWAKQISRQLSLYLRRVEDVLGKGWENHIEGQKLKADGDSFRLKLNPQPMFDDWCAKVQARSLGVSGRIFAVDTVRRRQDGKPILKLRVNFLPEIITLTKEVRNLKNMGFRVPLPIVNKALQANTLYPFAISLIESVHTYDSINERIQEKSGISLLIAGMKKEIQNLISEGVHLVWESYKLDGYVQRFSEMINTFQEKVEELLYLEEQIQAQLKSLDTCQYSAGIIEQILSSIQKAVDALSLHQYSNLVTWVQQLDEEIEKRLAFRLQEGVKAWTNVLEGKREEDDMDSTTDTIDMTKSRVGGDPVIPQMIHEMRLTQQVMYLSPSIEAARQNLLQQLFAWEAVVTTQTRISSNRYQVGFERSATGANYRNLLTKMPSGLTILEQAYSSVENLINKVKSYVGEWLRYQALWDLQPETLYERLGGDMSKWIKTLVEIKKARATFDTSETRKEFLPIIVDYAKVQSKVSLKYDSWHKDVLQKFGAQLGTEMQEFYRGIKKNRSDMEQQSVDAASTSEAVGFITYIQGLKRQLKNWEGQVETYKEGQRILERQRFQFPNTWLHSDQVDGEWSAFNDILHRKDSAIQTQVGTLQSKIKQEDTVVENRTVEILNEWEKQKPVEGTFRPENVLQALSLFESKLNRLKDDRDNIVKAKEALELTDPAHVSTQGERLKVALEELHDLKSVWQALRPIHVELDEMRDKPWLSVQPKKLRQQIDTLLNQLKDLPANYRSYNAYEQTKKMLQNFAKVNILIIELKSEALKERHWKQLMKQLRVEWILNDLTLGQVWDANLQRYESVIKDTLLVAQGELALEEFLKQVRESWQNYELDLVNYQNKTKLIRGWDDLFNKLKEHINSIHAMKLSPYYKEFEEDALGWEDKLNRITSLFDVWIDVQRRWVYLDGIFSGSADIKTLLPMETSKFQRQVAASPRVLEIVNVQGIQRQLERLADLLTKIQKALGEYLERERAAFPRFYFVGDEDLLEIIGNSKNIPRLQKHFKKMFSGVSAMLLNDDCSLCYGVASREGEEVKFINVVSIKDNPRVNAWLSMVENEIRNTLAVMLSQSIQELQQFRAKGAKDSKFYMEWLDKYPAQIVVLAAQISWSEEVEGLLNQNASLEPALTNVESMLTMLADNVLQEQPALRRKKLEHLITEFVHKRDVNRLLIDRKVQNSKSFDWLKQMRFYFDPNQSDVLKKLTINIANARFYYGFEYLGAQDKLVQTPLTDRCYLTMTQALEARLGGSPFGPAGTGKTESVKALGNQLGRFVLVFNCDETFDFQAMGRIFVGLCQVGAWGCFDEFNRLEERMLSAVSQQIQAIQETLRSMSQNSNLSACFTMTYKPIMQSQIFVNVVYVSIVSKIPYSPMGESSTVELIGKQVRVHPDMAIFITMNPGYAGRSNLPDNLKQLFRSLAMTSPDRQLIAQVMLFSQGFRSAEKLASKIVPFFTLCNEQLSNQSHYDFGLRALKYVLVSAGNVKRERIQKLKDEKLSRGEEVDEAVIAENLPEQEILIQSVRETMEPKLVAEDKPLLDSLLSDVFPGVPYEKAEMRKLRDEIKRVCDELFLCYSEIDGELGYKWAEKVIQLYQITQLNHGLMMVGPSGTGKSKAWRVLLTALKRVNGVEGVAHVIDPKAMSKEALYGSLDPNTREWTDGLFTHCLRKIIDNVRGEINKIQWIIFDGDVDPEWVENLNSVLDDNKLLTLPNGERLALPPNVRIMFEVQDLKYATLATVSRCGMVWFSDDVVSVEMCFENYFQRLRHVSLDAIEAASQTKMSKASSGSGTGGGSSTVTPTADAIKDDVLSPNLQVQRDICQILQPHFSPEGLITRCLNFAEEKVEHIMDFTKFRALNCLFSALNETAREVQNYNQQHTDFPMRYDQLERFVTKAMISSVIWSFTGDSKLKSRQELSDFIRSITTISLPPQENLPIIDFEVTIDGEWSSWQTKVPQIEVETHKVAAPDIVVPTLDTVRHERLLYTWLAEHKPMVLCGPPGSGKTMTLFSSLRALPDMEVVGLNFSSATTPELLMKTFDHYCEYKRTPNGVVLAPSQLGRWIILFCDEINLPDTDKYGTQRVISFLRQLVEHGGFYRTSDQTWVTLERIQFVGACNPPTDPGRKPLSHRSFADPLTSAMVEFYLLSQDKFTQDQQPHYVYSPRELTRWVRGICEAIRPLDTLTPEGLVRLWAHESLRLFQDRLITDEERKWTDQNIDAVATKNFPNIDCNVALQRPILYSCWLTKDYLPVSRDELRDYVKARLKVFYEEELDVPLVLFDEVLDHVLRIDRIFRQPQGHLLLIGVSGSGKTTLSRFVAWLNGLSVFQIKVHSKYTAADFDEDLRNVLRRSGCRGEKICFIMDESNVLDSGFLERMNTLLANGEVPGLFEGDEFTTLMTQIKEGSQREGLMLDSVDELYKWFTQQVMRNLHVVFTMNPSSEGLKDRAATSPALFNRCVLNWFGDWTDGALFRVGRELTNTMDIESIQFRPPDYFPYACESVPRPPQYRDAVVNAFVHVHQTLRQANTKLSKRGHRTTTVTPRHYLDFIQHYVKLYHEKRTELEEQQLHLNVGLNKIRETEEQVKELQKSLTLKSQELEAKNAAANAKLKQMLQDQQEAEKKKQVSEEIQTQLQVQLGIVARKQADVKKELEQVEPAVLDAQNAVRGIKKQHLVEIRSMANPPMPVKMALESICLLLGENASDWKVIRGVIVKDDFITRIVNFDTDSITSIQRQHLVVVRSLASPPDPVKLALEAVIFLLTRNQASLEWKNIRSFIMRDDFVSQILNFHPESAITDDIREKMKSRYFDNPEYNYEKVNRASQACGPMVKWAIAQINFADMLHKVEPLRNELKKLERDASENKKRGDEVNAVIAQLEKSIASYKEEYALLISDAQAIKADLAAVQGKVDRSIRLLTNLGSERKRWEQSSETFRSQMETIIGDVLLSAAFLAYAGYFDQQMRYSLYANWSHHLEMAAIQHRSDMARLEYLSNPDDRLRWQKNQLPSDDLCTENAIMLKRFNRFPLIIDPSGQAIDYLMNELKDKKITKTSFLDDSFRKNLESALRFGNPLLVQDVESYDPILNPVLNRELKRTGGRVLITLGDQDIDLSPSFQIFLSTRDPTIEFAPDVCSRVTFVNFTVTRSSLQSQCLNQVLKAERPDIDQKRSDLMKLQGEFALKLRHLEKSLLQALNDAKGKILDDDRVISTLETLKQEAAEVTKKAAETELVMMEVEKTSAQYTPLSISCASLYFTLEQMNQIHFLYQYSLQFFMDIFTSVLSDNSHLTGATDHTQRLSIITKDIFQITYDRVARGMLHEDRMTFAILLARIFLKGSSVESSYDTEFNHLLRGADTLGVTGDNNNTSLAGNRKDLQSILGKEQINGLSKLTTLPAFANCFDKIDARELSTWLNDQHPEKALLQVWESKETLTPIGESVHRLLLIHALRPDRFLAACHLFVTKVFGDNFTAQSEKVLDLPSIVDREIKSSTPVLLCSVPGYDASGRIDDLSAEMTKGLTSVAIGSAEGFAQADKTINSSAKSGRWVMLKNVHLAPQWLVQLEKKLHSLAPHPQFRLFLTMEIHPKLPFNLLRAGRILVFEPPPGIKANLLRTFSTIPSQRMSKSPAERARLYFILAWFHAIVQERLRYSPLGWSKKYEFSEADLRVACDTLDTCVELTAMGRANLPPEKVPWDAVKTLLSQCIYGGRVDNRFDQILLDCFIEKLFTSKSFDPDRILVQNVDGAGKNLTVPDGLRREQFVQWVESINELQSPYWLGLPNNAEKVLLTTRANMVLSNVMKMQDLEDDDVSGQGTVGKLLKMTDDDEELAYAAGTPGVAELAAADSRPLWMKQLFDASALWLKLLPQNLPTLRRTVENMRHPLYRFFEREINLGSRLLSDVRHDLSDLVLICQNQKKQTNHHRSLSTNLNKGIVPDTWRKYALPPGTTVIQWIYDFAERIKQLNEISNAFVKDQAKAFKNVRVWLGGLFAPEAYITATRQFVAQSNAWSLEELFLEVHVAESFDKLKFDDCSFGVTGLKLMGAKSVENSKLTICDQIFTDMRAVQFKWLRAEGKRADKATSGILTLPVYLHSTRQHLLFTLDFNAADNLEPRIFYERGVAVICSSQLN